jgi:hypothetical protein
VLEQQRANELDVAVDAVRVGERLEQGGVQQTAAEAAGGGGGGGQRSTPDVGVRLFTDYTTQYTGPEDW